MLTGRRRTRAALAALTALLLVGAAFSPTPAAADGVQCTADTPAADRPVLTKDASGSCVTLFQGRLAEAGFDVPASGVLDATTRAATRRLQASYRGLAITGTVDAATWAALDGGTRYSMNQGPTDGTHVFLTFDDCPNSLASFKETVRAAEGLGMALVLFPYGDCRSWGKIDIDYARAHGHYVFSHSATHAHLDRLSYDGVIRELESPAVAGAYGRPPYGGWNWTVKDAFAAEGMRLWGWTVDTLDWDDRTQREVIETILANAKAGDAVLMHMQYAAFNADALTQIKDGLAAKGLAVCRNHGAVSAESEVSC